MSMASLPSKLYLRALVLFIWAPVSVFGQNLLCYETTSGDASGYRCNGNEPQDQCVTYVILRTNSYYSSFFNLSFYLGINRFVIAELNGFSADTDFLPKDQPLLIPVDCRCNGSFFEAELTKIAIKGESFCGIADSLEGLTTCKAIRDKNPGISPWGLNDKVRVPVPLRCACPSSSEVSLGTKLLLSYPVSKGDAISKLALKFNTTPQAIISANNKSGGSAFSPESLVPFTSLLIPLKSEPTGDHPTKPYEPNFHFPATSSPVTSSHKKKKSKAWMIGLIALGGVAIGVIIAIAAVFLVIQLKRKKQNFCRSPDLELQQLSVSVRSRATSDKKVSFEGSLDPPDGHGIEPTPTKMLVETYTIKELKKASESFNVSNHIDGSVFHGRLNGKNLAIKRVQAETISKIEFGIFNDANHHHPNIIRLLGTCLNEGPVSFLVYEYARNGSLKDWLHGGLAMKNQFIASCYCFLTWNQRLRICLDVARALQYMHHTMNPSYVHRNVKSRNIFLDEEFNAKIGNFGMSRCVEDDTHEDPQFYSTNPASCSLGYLAPEYVHEGIVSPSVDIFAYGVILLEVLSGQTPITRPVEKGEGSIWLSEKIKLILQPGNAEELRGWIDSALGDNYSFDAAVTLANVARACTEDDPSMRPSAGEVVDKLSKLVEELPQGEQVFICESSSKPLMKETAANIL